MSTREELRAQRERERAELIERQAAERADAGLDPTPIATWNAFSPDQLADVIVGVTRCGAAQAKKIVHELGGGGTYTFSMERRDPFSGQLIGGSRWLAEHDPGIYAKWRLHLLLSEPEGVA